MPTQGNRVNSNRWAIFTVGAAAVALGVALLGTFLSLGGAGPNGKQRVGPTAAITIGNEIFRLEIASNDAAQERRLSGRDGIDADGGMIFVFLETQWQRFVMRDCAIPIDLLYLDESGRVLMMHAMVPEEPRSADEAAGDPVGDAAYNARLRSYSSNSPARFAIEIAGGEIQRLGLHEGDHVVLDIGALSYRRK